MINYVNKISSMIDVIEFENFKNSVFFINKTDISVLFYKYNKEKTKNKTSMIFQNKYMKNEFKTVFRKIYKINSEKFILASYTLKMFDENIGEYNIKGKNLMIFFNYDKNFNSFEKGKIHNIKISPLNKSICNYKNKYIIVSFFDTGDKYKNKDKKKKNTNKDEQYNFENKDFNLAFQTFEEPKKNNKYRMNRGIDDYSYYDDYDYYDHSYDDSDDNNYDNEDNIYYSHDITVHLLGVFNIITEELVSIYEFDSIKILYNINDNILILAEKNKEKRKVEQIANETIFHNYYNEKTIDETMIFDFYKRDNYIAFLTFDEGLRICQDNFDYSYIISFICEKDNLIIASDKFIHCIWYSWSLELDLKKMK